MVEIDFWFMVGQVCTLNFLFQALQAELNALTKEFKKYQVIFPWRGTQEMFIRGGSALRSNPLPFYIPFFTYLV